MASSSHLKPGDKGKIKVSVDIRGKTGLITKSVTVSTNDPKLPTVRLTIRIELKDRLHSGSLKSSEIFAGECRSCHVEQGNGKTGFDLFKADCFMCHNAGHSAPTFTQMSMKPRDYLSRIIREGVEDTMMPGWDTKRAGPLDDADIESLVDAIKQR